MASMQEALRDAYKFHRPCCVIHSLYRGYEAVELTEDQFMGNVVFVIPDNNRLPQPMGPDAENLLVEAFFESFGGTDWMLKYRDIPGNVTESFSSALGRKPKKPKAKKLKVRKRPK